MSTCRLDLLRGAERTASKCRGGRPTSDSDSVQWCRIEGIAWARLLFRWIELLLDWIPNVRLIDISAWADDTALAYFLFLSVWWFIV